jgi:hypothetical protein
VEEGAWPLQLAAAQGDAYARNDPYVSVKGVPQDDGEAVRLWRLAAAQGDAGARVAGGARRPKHDADGAVCQGGGDPELCARDEARI